MKSCRRSTTAAPSTIPGRSTKPPCPPPPAPSKASTISRSFAASTGSEEDDKDRDTQRVIHSSEIIHERDRDEIAYVVRGRSFLRYMVRKIVGTLIEVGKGRLSPTDIPEIFAARDRSRSGPTVPPEGLYLVSLEYPDPTDSFAKHATRRERTT